MGSRVQRGETASGPLVFWQDSDADLPKCVANDEGEDDCSLTTSDTKTRSLKPGTGCQIESRLIQINRRRSDCAFGQESAPPVPGGHGQGPKSQFQGSTSQGENFRPRCSHSFLIRSSRLAIASLQL